MTEPEVHILLLNYNSLAKLAACIASLERLEYSSYKLLLIDNGSPDGSGAELQRLFPAHRVLLIGENLGYAGGNNAGARVAFEQGAELVWILNPDTVVAPSALRELVAVHGALRRPGLVGSLILQDEGERIYFYKGIVEPDGKVRHAHADEPRSAVPELASASVGDTDFVNGASLLFSKQVADEIGLMSEDYFLYYEDADWSLRVRAKGFENRVAYRSVVRHMRADRPRANYVVEYYTRRNEYFFRERHGFPVGKRRALLRLRGRMAKYAVRALLGRRAAHNRNMRYVIGRVVRAIEENRLGREELALPYPD
ncbi:MAG TPA: glycosyltransferase family 2 protein [Gammaproteobacteria bacterium]|nr:glycosyltransferase family 2 protein [Gammaproteobacteria bacterium]